MSAYDSYLNSMRRQFGDALGGASWLGYRWHPDD
jgi:hypothetical protein